jgi:hypothetical protein
LKPVTKLLVFTSPWHQTHKSIDLVHEDVAPLKTHMMLVAQQM